MSASQIIWGSFLFLIIASGAGIMGLGVYWGGRENPPKRFVWGIVVMIAGMILGYTAVEAIVFIGNIEG